MGNRSLKLSFSQIKEILFTLFVLMLIMLTDSLWIRNVSFNRFYLMIVIGIVFFFLGLNHCPKKKFYTIGIIIAALFICLAINRDLSLMIPYKAAIVFIAWFVAYNVDYERLIKRYVDIMLFISVFSLLCMVFRDLIVGNPAIPTLPVGTYGTKALFFTNVKIGSNNLYFLRNQGPFWEPGVYQAYLNLALFYLVFAIHEKKKAWKIALLIIAIASTMSTTGYVVFAFIVMAYLLSKETRGIGNKIWIAVIAIAVVFLAINNDTVNYLLFDKLGATSINYISNATRLYSIVQNFKGIGMNPITGIGPSSFSKLFEDSTSIFGVVSTGVNTTTSLSVWALYGVIYFVIFNLGILCFPRQFVHNTTPYILVIVALIIIYNTESLNYSLFFNIVTMIGLVSFRRRNQRQET